MAAGAPPGISIEVATDGEHVAVSRVLDGALLEHAELRARLAAGTVLVAKREETVVAAIVVDASGAPERSPPADWPESHHVEAIAVRRKRRRNGIGAALLRAATRRWGPLTADFEERVRPFYESVGAECRRADAGDAAERWWALLREIDAEDDGHR